ERRTGTIAERDAIANAGWVRFVEGVEESLPNPHDPLHAIDRLAAVDALTIAERVEQLGLDREQHDVLWAELESLAHGPLDDAGAVRDAAGDAGRRRAPDRRRGRDRDARRRAAPRAAGRRCRPAEHARRDRVRSAAVRGQAGGDRPR